MTTTIFSQTPSLETGVSQKLAQWRAAHYSDIRYRLNLTLEKMAPLMKGEIEISVTLDEEGANNDLILDWRTTQFQNDKDKTFADVLEVNKSVIKKLPDSGNFAYLIDKEHLVIAKRLLKKGENVIKIQFASPIKTSGSAITRYIDKEDGSEYIYSLFVPSDASTAFPVFDQPDLKARFKLDLTVPNEWTTVSNQIEPNISYNDDKTITHSFAETKPISTYVFAFSAGNFQEFSEVDLPKIGSGSKNAYTISRSSERLIFVRKSQAEKFKQHSAEIFRLNRESIKYFEDYFNYKFPFPKYDLVLIPEFPFGGMEHAGATFLRESSIIFPSEPTKSDLINRATLIFHENAHQWFGDTVTMKWFDDLWLKEGFATFMAYKAVEKIMPEMNAWKVFYERIKQPAYQTDSTKGTVPIYQDIPNLSAAKSAYGNIVYNKAPAFLRQAEFYLGEKEFQTAVRSFLKKHEFKNATWQDLVSEFEIAKKEDLKDWANNWVTKRGLSIIQYRYSNDMGSIYFERVNNEDYLNEGVTRKQRIKVLLRTFNNGESKILEGDVDKNIPPENISSFVHLYFPNYQDYGYGIFLLDEKSRNYILANVQNEKDDFLRSMMYGSLWDSVREAELNPKDYVELVIKNVSDEKDEMIVASMLGRANTAFAYYLDEKSRNELSPKLEEILINKMQSAETLGQRITFYRSFLSVANSEKGKTILKDILSSKFKIEGLTLKTKDKFDIVTKLFILNDKDAPNLLADLEKTETSDDAKRYAYAARAGIATAENKLKYFNDFIANKEISESWIEAAFVPFNSVRHSDLTLPYLEKALNELPNHKRNRKIFFVNGWLGAFIGGQKSEEALQIVNKFSADNTGLDKDLRLKILENVDVIERAVKIRSKYK